MHVFYQMNRRPFAPRSRPRFTLEARPNCFKVAGHETQIIDPRVSAAGYYLFLIKFKCYSWPIDGIIVVGRRYFVGNQSMVSGPGRWLSAGREKGLMT